ncbi:ASCH domain-containing protein [Ottowia sp. VDI28]|uniref:ASCH domain-containing protein n=1 Tax=Ottowia sp. VDI28 TaxID=3133968 RepID=UPI003C305247
MLALSIRQPWASLIIKAGKDIENRDWSTPVRGRILVHAAKGMTRDEHEDAIVFAVSAIRTDPRNVGATRTRTLRDLGFAFEDLPRGGFVGTVEIVDCAQSSASPWFMGRYGFALRDPQPMDFVPWKGQLGFFEVTDAALEVARAQAKEGGPDAL